MVLRRFPLLVRTAAIALLLATIMAGPIGASAVSAANAPTIGIGKPTVTPDTGTTTSSGDDASVFASYLNQESKATRLFGPDKGDLAHNSEKITTSATGLDVQSFIAHADFGNPYAATSSSGFDFGILFRLGLATHFRVIVTSDGNWYLTPGASDPLDKGTISDVDTSANGTNSMDLVVVGDVGYLGVNGKFVAKLDLSSSSGKGDVAVGTAFFASNFKDGASTAYSNFTVWSVKEGAAPGPDTTPTVVVPGSPVANNGEGYVSPQFGYTIAYDSTWTASGATSDNNGDLVRLSNGVSSVDFAGFATKLTPKQCIQDEFDFFNTSPGYTNVAVAQDTNNKDMTGTIEGGVYEVIRFSYTSGEETPVDYAASVECLVIQDGTSLLRIDQFVEASSYNDQIDAVTSLLQGLKIQGQSTSDVTPTETTTDVTPTETTTDVTPTTESGTATGAVTFQIESDGSPVGLAQISADPKDDAKADVTISAADLPDGSIALIHKGTCDSFTSAPAYYLNAFDADGTSATSVKATVAKLTTGGYVVVIHESLDDLTKAYACGAIG